VSEWRFAAELDRSGLTVNVYRSCALGTAVQRWVRDQASDQIGAALHDRFEAMRANRRLISAERSARSLLVGIASDASGQTGASMAARIDARGGSLDARWIFESHDHGRS
jgi:hypothetical protein